MISISRLPVFLAIRLQYSSDAAIDQSLVSVIGSNLPLERLMSSVMFTVVGDRSNLPLDFVPVFF